MQPTGQWFSMDSSHPACLKTGGYIHVQQNLPILSYATPSGWSSNQAAQGAKLEPLEELRFLATSQRCRLGNSEVWRTSHLNQVVRRCCCCKGSGESADRQTVCIVYGCFLQEPCNVTLLGNFLLQHSCPVAISFFPNGNLHAVLLRNLW